MFWGLPSLTYHHYLRYDAYAKAAEQFTTHQAYIKNAATAATVIDDALVRCMTKASPRAMSCCGLLE